MSARAMGSHQSARAKTTTWLTPPELIQALGPFDLDPCAAPSPRPWPTAAQHIELPRDGLAEPWSGYVWLNPPYSHAAWAWGADVSKIEQLVAEHNERFHGVVAPPKNEGGNDD